MNLKRPLFQFFRFHWLIMLIMFTPMAHAQKAEFPVKGFHLDLRIQVMKMPKLKAFVKDLSANGINTLIMEWEGTYPFEKHPVIQNQYAYSRQEIVDFVSYCETLGVDVIPLQQSFGHVEYILKNYRYRDLREDQQDFSQVNPIKEDLCRSLFADLFADMISTHRSPYFHIGGDETYLLGKGKESKAKAEKVGLGRVYGDYIKMLCELVISLGKTPVVWADIALKYPDALEGLPKQTVFVDWNYGWELDRFGDHKKLVESGFEIWGAPAIRSYPDTYFLTDWWKHLNNVKTFIPQAKELGYKGIVITSWSTSGLYSTIMESSSDLVDLHAIRRVYPISGFSLLTNAFFTAVNQSESLDIEEFSTDYAQKRYGLDENNASAFYRALISAPYEVNQGKVSKAGMSLPTLIDSAHHTLQTFENLPVKSNKQEFAHYKLMANIRYNYLVCIAVENELNQVAFKQADAANALAKLKRLNVKEVDKEFKALQSDLLFDSEIKQEEYLRNYRYHLLVSKLEKWIQNQS
ncbi:family 20 glycosylhydrolase [Sphingobacterium corticis]|uniref:Family 20 glycosylhydrolase n=1 Tax=Sphingobacterium corticis TaxID=1812823 RepID=A0ABW5NM25_9SPHI